MAVLYYVDFSSAKEEDILNKYMDKIDKERLSKITRTRDITARVRSLLAGYLLQVAIKENDKEFSDKERVLELTYHYGKSGKPYLTDYPDLYFSLSHSGSVVACLCDTQEVGLDVQQHVNVKERIAKRFFSQKEYEMLVREEDSRVREQLFFRMWSIKESYIKYTGEGMSRGLDSFVIDPERCIVMDESREVCYEEIKPEGISGYSVCACMEKREKIEIRKIEI